MPNTEEQEAPITEAEADAILDDAEVDYEAEARKEGWVPKEDFRGPDTQWKDAKSFVEAGREILPIVNAKNRRLEQKISELEGTIKKFVPFMDESIERVKKEKDTEIARLRAERKQAIDEGDGARFDAADAKIAELQQPETARPQKPQAVIDWEVRHPEYQSGANGAPTNEYTAVVNGLADLAIATVGPNAPVEVYLAELDRRIDGHFKKPKPQAVEGSRPTKQARSKHSYENLPDEARKACDGFVKDIPGFTVEKYLETYDWSE